MKRACLLLAALVLASGCVQPTGDAVQASNYAVAYAASWLLGNETAVHVVGSSSEVRQGLLLVAGTAGDAWSAHPPWGVQRVHVGPGEDPHAHHDHGHDGHDHDHDAHDAHDHAGPDAPWLDPRWLADAADRAAPHLDAPDERRDSLHHALASLHGDWLRDLRQCETRHVLAAGAQYGSWTEPYDLFPHDVDALLADASWDDLRLLRDEVAATHVAFPEAPPTALANQLWKEAGLRVTVLPALGDDAGMGPGDTYFSVMQGTLEKLRAVLRCT